MCSNYYKRCNSQSARSAVLNSRGPRSQVADADDEINLTNNLDGTQQPVAAGKSQRTATINDGEADDINQTYNPVQTKP